MTTTGEGTGGRTESRAEGQLPPGTRALARGLLLLDLIGRDREPMSLTELAAAARLDKGTVSRLLTVLVGAGHANRREADGRYLPGRALARLGAAYTARFDLAAAARPHLHELVARTGESAHLAVVDGLDIVYVDHLPPPHALRARAVVGQALPLHVTAMGRAVLAALDAPARARTLDALAARTEHDHLVGDLADLAAAVAASAHRGWATVDRDDDLSRVAAAVLDASGRPMGAVSVSGPRYRMAGDLARCGEQCAAAARAIGLHLGGGGEVRSARGSAAAEAGGSPPPTGPRPPDPGATDRRASDASAGDPRPCAPGAPPPGGAVTAARSGR
ncbi:IclR family transcriptional regulator [Streptomyces sp. NPDC060194]|uniref:IclR family transcriptional regulator n=1 Tax=Streptomyces sp. NPDC060194 TaxID=3347069 RepID=UPI003657F528